MNSLFLVALLMGAGQAPQAPAPPPTTPVVAAPAGHADAGKTVWTSNTTACRNCHGPNGEGMFGPDLAGRGLSAEQVIRAVRKPWGIMPAYTETQITDQQLADIASYFGSLPKVTAMGIPRFAAVNGGPNGQRLIIESYGCANCHQPELADPRRVLGGQAKDVNFDYFKKLVYNHTDEYPNGRMGNFNRDRTPEPMLQEVFSFISALGLRVPVTAAVSAPKVDGANTTYTLTLKNEGDKAKGGLVAEDLTVNLLLPAGATVVSQTGANYQGVKRDAAANTDTAVWTLARISPEDVVTYSITLTGGASANGMARGSVVRWTKPQLRDRPGAPQLTLKDARIPDKGDQVPVTLPPGAGRGAPPAPAAGRAPATP